MACPPGRKVHLMRIGGMGLVDAFRVNQDGTLTKVGSADIPGAAGGQGIAAS